MILGTAGHIDHGKTALVRALTGVDTDRLPEEKRRGITIDLGFAPLHLAGVETLGVVDVPGHEAFVRTMLAGSTGIDLALLVVAADEGVRPQTREHLHILSLLEVESGVIALTKSDLVDPEWLQMVREEVAALVATTPLAAAPIVAVSALTGDGLGALREALGNAAAGVKQRAGDDLFRMPIDRAFTVRGTGTVVTGTVWSGELRRGGARLFPGGRAVRVRELQSHGSSVERVGPGTRAAVALVDVAVDDVARGAVLVTGEAWVETSLWRVEVTLLEAEAAVISPRTRLRLHIGASDIGARLRMFKPGGDGSVPARLKLDEPAIARAGDRFVLRGGSPPRVIGGGVVVDPLPLDRRARPVAGHAASAAGRLRAFADEAKGDGLARDSLPIKLGLSPREIATLLPEAGVVATEPRVYSRSVFAAVSRQVGELVAAHHASDPTDPGVSLDEVRTRITASPDLVAAALRELERSGTIILAGTVAHLPGWTPKLLGDHARLAEQVVDMYRAAAEEPPTIAEVTAKHGPETLPVLRFLERDGRIVRISPDLYYWAPVSEAMVARIREAMGRAAGGREFTPSELREVLGVSRKYLIPFLEFCDLSGVTARRGAGRVLLAGAGGRP